MQRGSKVGLTVAGVLLTAAGMVMSGAFQPLFREAASPQYAAALSRLDEKRRREEKEDNRRGDLPPAAHGGAYEDADEDDGKAARRAPKRPIVWHAPVASNR